MSNYFGKKFVLVLSFLAVFFIPTDASACSCNVSALLSGKTEKQLIERERKNSKAVFTGEVIEIIVPKTASGGNSISAEVRFKVLRGWKGTTTEIISVFTANVCCICGYKFIVGERYLVYAFGSGKILETNICTRTKLLSESNEDLKVLGKSKIIKR